MSDEERMQNAQDIGIVLGVLDTLAIPGATDMPESVDRAHAATLRIKDRFLSEREVEV